MLIGDASKAKEKLGWEPEHSLDELIYDMVLYDLKKNYMELILKGKGFDIHNSCGV